MINVTGFRYCRLGTANLEETVKFAKDIIGLELVDIKDGFAYMRGDDRDHNIVYFQGDPNDHTCLLYTSPSPRDGLLSRMPSSA